MKFEKAFILFLGFLSILFIPFYGAVSLNSETILNATSSNSVISFDVPVSANVVNIESTYVYLQDISYTYQGISYSCASYNNSEENSIIQAHTLCLSSSGSNSDSPSKGGYFTPTQNNLQNGYTVIMRKSFKISFKINNQTNQIEVTGVNKTTNKVMVNVNGTDYDLSVNETKKIDLNDDGFYDLSISVNSIDSYENANMTFTEIHEEIPSEQSGSQTGNVSEDISPIAKSVAWYWYFLLGIIVLLVLLGSLRKSLLRGHSRRKVRRR